MKLKFKKISLAAGRPIAFINKTAAKKAGFYKGDRVEISLFGKKITLVLNVADKILDEDEFSLSEEAVVSLGIKEGNFADISQAIEPKSNWFIVKKLKGEELSREEIDEIIKDIVRNALNEAEIAYFVSGVYERGMSLKETIFLTEAMAKNGKSITWNTKNIADKHSIGGIPGNRTTPIIVSICAAAGIVMPKTSSRAITAAAGTADTMETITNVSFSGEELKRIVKKTNACLAWGGSLGLAPSDDKLIKVERILGIDPESQLIASILSKKISAGSNYVLIDIPSGKGAKVSSAKAKELKKKFIKVGEHFKLKIKVLITDGSQPIGNGVGPALEMRDILNVLRRENSPRDLENKSLLIAGQIIEMMKKAKKGDGIRLVEKILNSKQALNKFYEIIEAQGKKEDYKKNSRFKYDKSSKITGVVKEIKNKDINLLARILGSPSDHSARIYLHKHVGDKVKKGEIIISFYSNNEMKLKEGLAFYEKCDPLIIKKI